METDDAFEGAAKVGAEERFRLAVDELMWSEANAAFDGVALENLVGMRRRPGLEEAVVKALCIGPVAITRRITRRLWEDVGLSGRSLAVIKEGILLGVFRFNLKWAGERREAADYPAAAEHFSRACRVPLIREWQASAVRKELHALVQAAEKIETRFGSALGDPKYLLLTREATALISKVAGEADPGPWMSATLLGISSSEHLGGLMNASLAQVLLRLSWPTLRALSWLPFLHPEALPSPAGFPYVSVQWLQLDAAPPTTEPGQAVDEGSAE